MVSKKLENQHIPTQCNFKQNTKKNIVETRKTIDQIHSENLSRFKENDRLKVHIRILEKELKLRPKIASLDEPLDIEFNNIDHLIIEYRKQWKEDDNYMIEYLTNLGKFLLREHNTLEQVHDKNYNEFVEPVNYKKSFSERPYNYNVTSKQNNIKNDFNTNHKGNANGGESSLQFLNYKSNTKGGLDKIISHSGANKKGSRHKDFLSEVCNEKEVVDYHKDFHFCDKCSCLKIIDYVNSTNVCPNCGSSDYYIDNSGANYNAFVDDTIECIPVYEYKRINHLNDWIASFQGVENVVISNEIILLVDNEIKKQRLDKRRLKPADIKLILKKLRLNKYYEHIYAILARITNKKPVSLTSELQETIRTMFIRAEKTFIDMENKGRTNFLSYSYLLHKFMQLVGRDDLVDFFPLLKSRTKLYQQDQIWKQICNKNNWEFKPSM
tara:strand:+ start:1233 stop:2549 length:1317 start_codon:yes stop_codon:yes gene_type:complete